jgi:hypothetical protein
MSTTYTESPTAEAAAYGGLVDAVGGIATVVLAIVALAGYQPGILAAIAVIVFGAALLIQGGTVLSEYSNIMFPAGSAASATVQEFPAGGLPVMFLVGAAGIVLGVLALLSIAAGMLTAVAIIAFGGALVLSSNSVRQLYMLQGAAMRAAGPRMGGMFLAGEMASSSAGVQLLAGLAAIVLGILAVSGVRSDILDLSALLVLGVTVIMTGSTLSGLVLGFMRPARMTA